MGPWAPGKQPSHGPLPLEANSDDPADFEMVEHGIFSLFSVCGTCLTSPSCSPQIRTKDRVFDNISHLINHHLESRLPIVSAGSELCLQQPVERKQ